MRVQQGLRLQIDQAWSYRAAVISSAAQHDDARRCEQTI